MDPASYTILRELQKDLLDSPNIGGEFDLTIPPHISIMEHPDLLHDEIISVIKSYCTSQQSFKIHYSSVAYFPATQVLFLNPKESTALTAFKYDLLSALKEIGVQHNRIPNQPWIPHSTLLQNLPVEDVSNAIPLIQQHLDMQIGKPFTSYVRDAILFSYPPYRAEHRFQLHD
ncbi:MAG: 2'-5' RNA ligase family protein [Candidatus Heimdallarchaeota archaeon]|nr:2'-5' RNA ligase family protein [Candidatus Heimdallarchaeota archaeon]